MALSTNEKTLFLDLLLSSGALKFGSFTTKSGRKSPYFLNSGSFDDGVVLSAVAECYATLAIHERPVASWHLYGPAYKGITLASATAQALSKRLNLPVPFTFNRKEVKDHGEGGLFIGRAVTASSELVIVEDVLTGGTSVKETLEILKPTSAVVKTLLVGVDREEQGGDKRLARDELKEKYGISVLSILTLTDIIHLLWKKPRLGRVWIDDDTKERIEAYQREFGARF